MAALSEQQAILFWNNVNKTPECWIWTGRVATDGTPMFWHKHVGRSAPRAALELVAGTIPDGARVFNTCGERLCVNPSHHAARTAVDLFFAHVNKNGPCVREGLTPCWIWSGAKTKLGYGRFSMGKRQGRKAHRVSWEIAFGPIKDGGNVLHKCDNPPCVNPEHLFLGTIADNSKDMHSKGRYKGCAKKGSAHSQAKLHETDIPKIRAMRADGRTCGAIAKQFGVSQSMISFITTGHSWKHVS